MIAESDCHVGNWKSTEYQGVKFRECLARVLALDPLPGRIFILGDLAYLWGRKEDYALSRQLLQPVLDAARARTQSLRRPEGRMSGCSQFVMPGLLACGVRR